MRMSKAIHCGCGSVLRSEFTKQRGVCSTCRPTFRDWYQMNKHRYRERYQRDREKIKQHYAENRALFRKKYLDKFDPIEDIKVMFRKAAP